MAGGLPAEPPPARWRRLRGANDGFVLDDPALRTDAPDDGGSARPRIAVTAAAHSSFRDTGLVAEGPSRDVRVGLPAERRRTSGSAEPPAADGPMTGAGQGFHALAAAASGVICRRCRTAPLHLPALLPLPRPIDVPGAAPPAMTTHPTTALPRRLLPVALLMAQWIAMCVVAHPVGEFPINDDWAFVAAVRAFLETGQVRAPDWASMNFIGHLFWGALFGVPLGTSYFALRISGMTAGLIGVLATFAICRELGISRRLAWLAAAMLAANPIYFSLSTTFLTDMSFLAMVLASAWMYTRALRTGLGGWEVGGTLLAVWAIWNRQTGMAVPLAYAVALLARDGANRRTLLRAAVVCAIGVGAHLALRTWMSVTDTAPAFYGRQIEQVRSTLALSWKWLLVHFALQGTMLWTYVGLSCAAALVAVLPAVMPRVQRRPLVVAAFLGLLGLAVFAVLRALDRRMPLLDNQVGVTGLIQQLPGPESPGAAQQVVWTAITVVATIAAAWLAYAVFLAVRCAWRLRRQDRAVAPAVIFILAFGLIYTAPVIGVSWVYDRYVAPLIPLVAVPVCWLPWATGTVAELRRARVSAAVAVLGVVLMGALTAALARDYFALQRARWTELHWLTGTAGVSSRVIAGGFEFNGLMNFTPKELKRGPKGWWVYDDLYRLAVAPQPGYETIRERPVETLLPFSPDRVLVIRRIDARPVQH